MQYLEKKISNLIESQFPSFYHEEGPLFVEFVKQYYKWMETVTPSKSNTWINDKLSYVKVQSGNLSITGVQTKFSSFFSNGDLIAITREEDSKNYDIFNINSISNNTFLTLTSLPSFSSSKSKYSKVANTGNPIYFSRNFDVIHDIDETLENFLVYFKEKYLKNLQFINITNTRNLVKHSLDLYRSKGTERSIELLFKIAFGITPRIYYPSSDLFKLSDGQWYIPRYIEVSMHPRVHEFVNKEIIGLKSGATAFAESVIRKTVNGKLIDVIYVSTINGNFSTGEPINTTDGLLTVLECPIMIGSLSKILIESDGVGDSFKVGDVLGVSSSRGRQAKARVAKISNTSGSVTMYLVNGGYGYSNSPTVFISDHIVTISNVAYTNTTTEAYYNKFHKLVQPLAQLNYISSNGSFEEDDLIFTYHANNSVKGQGRVLTTSSTNSTSGNLMVSILSGNLNSNQIFTQSNAIGANLSLVDGYTDLTAQGNVVGLHSSMLLDISDVTGTFSNGVGIFQYNASNVITARGTMYGDFVGTSGRINIINSNGAFHTQSKIFTTSNAQSANLVSSEIKVGVKIIGNNSFIDNGINYIYSTNSSANGIVTRISSGSGADISFSSNLIYTEFIRLNSDYILPFVGLALNANSWPFAGLSTANVTNCTIEEALRYSNTMIGKLNSIISVNKGSDYNDIPIIKILEPLIRPYHLDDAFKISYSNSSVSFEVGEFVEQPATGARGIIEEANSTHLIVERLNFFNDDTWILTTNSSTRIEGGSSGASANIDIVELIESDFLGENAIIGAELNIANGAIAELQVIDSGFGFIDEETLSIFSNSQSVTAIAKLENHGQGTGFYISRGGELSGTKKLFDGYYYQNFSYEIRSSKMLNEYLSMLRNVVHVAGTKPFGAFYYDTDATSDIDIEAKITVT